MYIKRDLSKHILKLGKGFPIIGIFGPRQSGKTTLARQVFPKYKYVNLENLSTIQAVKIDTKKYLEENCNGLIIDEAQKYPDLFSYLQVVVDEQRSASKYVLTGSENYLLSNKISQSLAGRIGLTTLLPFSINELPTTNINKTIFTGSYPRVNNDKLNPMDFYDAYISTYVERDVRNIINLVKYDKFIKLLKVLATRSGQVLNLEGIMKDTDINRETAENWISILKATYIVFTLQPYHNNFGKRIIKSPKLYFFDSGLLCRLLDISNYTGLVKREDYGAIFETFVISEVVKFNYNFSAHCNLYYWRDSNKNEIDLLIEKGERLEVFEIKSSTVLKKASAATVIWFNSVVKKDCIGSLISQANTKFADIQNINIKELHQYLIKNYT